MGLFVILSLVVGVAVVIGISSERLLFDDAVYYKASFDDAQGLRKGQQVRIGGVSAGEVTAIRFPDDARTKKVVVVFEIRGKYAERIRENSIVKIDSKGVLGDKMLAITPGTSDQPMIAPWGWVPSRRTRDVMEQAANAVAQAEEALGRVNRAIGLLASEEVARDVRETAANIRDITHAINHGEGAANALLHDPRTRDNLNSALAGLAATSRELSGASHEIRTMLGEVRTGHGALHALIYERDGAQAVASLGRAADEIATLMHDVRTEQGLLHSLIYTDEQANLLANLTETSAGVRQIVSDLRAGRGTIGALLVDPSVYEDLKRVVGNVGRSRALRALVRYSITEDEERPGPPAVERGTDGQNGQ